MQDTVIPSAKRECIPRTAKRDPKTRLPRILHSPHGPWMMASIRRRAKRQGAGERHTETGRTRERHDVGVGCITDGPTCSSLASSAPSAQRAATGCVVLRQRVQLKRTSRWRAPACDKRLQTERRAIHGSASVDQDLDGLCCLLSGFHPLPLARQDACPKKQPVE